MCFRPPGAAKAVKCPSCGCFNPPTLKKCKKCGADMPAENGSTTGGKETAK
ncbi:hypothetical protein SPACI_022840 [Sporomusa acidovorans DSM 3132]|uniref:RanBP2-type domain-containing protein n=1 Tax=Sporomusa acidovorans (strain ATCC 49682 / DSM 3132 / Mol) TaxID=1123286 RepID=A0ABZ3J2D5_SPOA4|nr:hypothetical protein SPACI_35970 [Sporomusa acidovorans DSM 3132]SDF72814.1 hypothetical protein SAMN04488499_10736 [Sporomusa acidovorans]